MAVERLAPVRARVTLIAVVVVGAALALGAVALVALLRSALVDEVRAAAAARARDVAAELEGGAVADLAVADDDEAFVQVLRDGRVVAASDNVAGLAPLVRLAPGRSTTFEPPIADDGDRFVAVAVAPRDGEDRVTVVAGQSLEDVSEATGVAATLLALGVPLIVVLVGATTWWLVGRTLAPVDAITREVDDISAAALDRRVPQPRTADEVGRLAATMNRMLARLESARDRQRRFVSDASHELRSPLASIRQHAEVSLAYPDRSDPARFADTVLAETVRMQAIVEDLLLLSRRDEGTLSLHRSAVDLDDVVFDEARRARDSGRRVDTSAVAPVRAAVDELAMRRVVRNLADNAVRHAETTVAIALAERDGHAEITVDDDGSGIPPAERERVLERFVRLDDARSRDAGGAGLGLAIAAELVAAHGGSLTVAEAPLGGARVVVRVPVEAPDGRP